MAGAAMVGGAMVGAAGVVLMLGAAGNAPTIGVAIVGVAYPPAAPMAMGGATGVGMAMGVGVILGVGMAGAAYETGAADCAVLCDVAA